MKIIFISEAPFIEQSKKDLYYNEISKEFKTEIWDLSLIYKRKYELPHMAKEVLKISTIEELKVNLSMLPEKSVIITASRAYGLSLKIFKIINKLGHKVFYLKKELINDEVMKYSKLIIKDSVLTSFSKMNPKFFFTRFLIKIKLLKKFEYDYAFQISNVETSKAKNVIKGHNIKYQEFLQTLKEKRLIKKEYIVFLDTDMAYHHDLTKDIEDDNICPQKYLKKMNELFNIIEEKYGVDVVIAAHPKSNYTDEFLERKVIKYKTSNLIVNSKGVIAHIGTSIATAVLANKPLIFPYYPEMLEKSSKGWIKTSNGYAQYLKAPFINLDKSNYSFEFDYSGDRYNKFVNNMVISKENINLSNAEILIKSLKQGYIRKGL